MGMTIGSNAILRRRLKVLADQEIGKFEVVPSGSKGGFRAARTQQTD
jgi:hypothetical protein